MKLYGNIVIGNFLYGLGFVIAKPTASCDFPSIVNLLQQTPDDAVFGDHLFKAPGMLRIIEFKQRSNMYGKVAIGDLSSLIYPDNENDDYEGLE
ncbi:hypothetical protein [Fluviibacter phosphoraccumulans]|uniref:hypothetical protein n=1 Tax=Fluviibacter phosphoraccumulans TaxID=1751046 RepID=UPI0010B540F6|nr:hypothetical protein [Fluviibacter phosphoraccumulans]BCA64663.1 hypothetical protein SHINM1_002650 [Fluviibacter phosphoraccumulans]